jgi:HEAT repeat protein
MTLATMAEQSTGIAELIVQTPGAVAGLVAVLKDETVSIWDLMMITTVRQEAANALACLAGATPGNQTRIAAGPGAVERLRELLHMREPVAQAAAHALANLAAGSPAIGERIGQEPGVISGIVALLSRSAAAVGDTASVVQCAATMALRALVESAANRGRIRCQLSNNLEAVKGLVGLLDFRENSRVRNAAGTVLTTVDARQFLPTLAGGQRADGLQARRRRTR